MEAWAYSDARLWLQSCGLSDTKLSELFDTYHIDGECILEVSGYFLGIQLFSLLHRKLDEKFFTQGLSGDSLIVFQKEFQKLKDVAKEYLQVLASAPEQARLMTSL